MDKDIVKKINELGSTGEPFLFVISYDGTKAYVRKLSDINPEDCLYDFNGKTNINEKTASPLTSKITWEVDAPQYEEYEKSFDIVKRNMLAGNSYLANLTCRVPVRCNLSLHEIFLRSKGKYKLLMNDSTDNIGSFVCFSPEKFLQIRDGRIFSYPMKGTINASLPNAEKELMNDEKEAAEQRHHR